jgi:hypothetical protein
MYALSMRDSEKLKIPAIIAAFRAASFSLHDYLQQRRPLSSHQLESLALTVSLSQFYLERWKRQHRPTSEFSGRGTISSVAALFGRLGGLKGGKARAKKLSAKKRAAIARDAAFSRWGKISRRMKPAR